MNESQVTNHREDAVGTYFHGRLAAEEMRTLREIAAAFGTTPAHAMRIILQRVKVQPPVILLPTEPQ